MNQHPAAQQLDSHWGALARIGGMAALVAALFFRRNCGVELVTFNGFGIWDPPSLTPISAKNWFGLFQSDPFVSLVLFGLVDLINYALVGLIFLALFGVLHQSNRSAMLTALSMGLVGIAVFFATNQAFSMQNLSRQFATASDAQQAMLLTAGEALLAIHNPGLIYQGTGYYVSLLLVLLAGLVISVVMLRSRLFNKWTAYAGILANGIGLGYFLALIFAPRLLWIPPTLSAPFRILWYILLAVRLLRLPRAMK